MSKHPVGHLQAGGKRRAASHLRAGGRRRAAGHLQAGEKRRAEGLLQAAELKRPASLRLGGNQLLFGRGRRWQQQQGQRPERKTSSSWFFCTVNPNRNLLSSM